MPTLRTYAVYLIPRTSFASPVSSETLFGALCWAVWALHGRTVLDKRLESFTEDPPFVVSSAFPFLRYEAAKVRCYPKPLLPELSSAEAQALAQREARHDRYDSLAEKKALLRVVEKAKRIKAAAYVSEQLFTGIVCGEMTVRTLCERLVEKETGAADADVEGWGRTLLTYGERRQVTGGDLKDFTAEGDVQRNEIDRVGLATVEGRLFFLHETFLHRDHAGLWFVLRTPDLEFVKPLLRWVEDTGLGPDRSVGKGHFHIPLEKIHEVALPDFDGEANCFVTLSRYLPAEGECNFGGRPLSYALSTHRPKHEARLPGLRQHIYKGLLRVFEPGSYFPFRERKEVYGQVVYVGPGAEEGGVRAAYHNGLALPVLARIGGEAHV